MAQAIESRSGALVAACARDLATGKFESHREQERLHAASLAKVPLLLTLLGQAEEGAIRLDEPILVANEFRALSGGTFQIDRAGDDDTEPWQRLGRSAPAAWLAERMILRSSNLAANLLLERVGATAVTQLCRELGAGKMQVVRCFEDEAAFAAGINNTTTAADLCALFAAIGQGRAPGSLAAMGLLERQELPSGLRLGVPPGVRVASKTGQITRHGHEAGLIFPEGRAPYVLAVMTRGFADHAAAERAIAELSAAAWAQFTN